jgi:hypothetical protein
MAERASKRANTSDDDETKERRAIFLQCSKEELSKEEVDRIVQFDGTPPNSDLIRFKEYYDKLEERDSQRAQLYERKAKMRKRREEERKEKREKEAEKAKMIQERGLNSWRDLLSASLSSSFSFLSSSLLFLIFAFHAYN